ncbi:MAG: hypothetical protein A2428_14340 [Bdellovibrionales bacterium RIFOXYC1_FULL_54_43]|nr:MAG: hypothetical protein A2428_14340 [Bdellovibrionales bacterium RIFOXYC1_FULL_54_43]
MHNQPASMIALARCCIVVLALVVLTRGEAQEVPAFTIRSAVDAALAHDPAVQSAREKLNEVDAAFTVSVAQILPNVATTGTFSYRKDALNVGNPAFGGEPYNYYQLAFQGTQPLFDLGVLAAIKGGRKEKSIRQLEIEIAERDLTLRVIQSFYNLVLNERRLQVLLRTEVVEKKVLATAQARLKIGRTQLLDVLQIQTQLALLAPKIAQARSQIEIAAAELASLLGDKNLKQIRIEGVLDFPNWKRISESLKAKPYRLPEIERVNLLQDQFTDKNSLAMAKHWPKLNAVGNWGRASFAKSELLDGYSTNWSVGVQLTIPLFSGLSSVWERKQLASQEAQLQIEEARTRDKASLDQIRSEKGLALQLSLIESSRLAFEYARDSLKEAEKEYRFSRTDYLQLLKAEETNLQAESSYDQAKYDLIVGAAKYYVASGYSLSELVEWLEKRELATPKGGS